MKALPVLQSGFIALSDKGLRLPEVANLTLGEIIIDKSVKDPLNKYFYSNEITDIFIRWSNEPKCLKDFDYRENLLKTALSIFGDDSFYKWLDQQVQRETIGDLHNAFILETLEYLLTDKPRSIQNIQWYRLLQATESSTKVKVDLTKYFIAQGSNRTRLPMSLDNIIKLWVTKKNGFEDLLISLYAIFGERSVRANLTKQST